MTFVGSDGQERCRDYGDAKLRWGFVACRHGFGGDGWLVVCRPELSQAGLLVLVSGFDAGKFMQACLVHCGQGTVENGVTRRNRASWLTVDVRWFPLAVVG